MRISFQLALCSAVVAFSVLPSIGCSSSSSGAVQGVPNYFVMPPWSKDAPGLAPAINDPGPGPVDASQCSGPGGLPPGVDRIVIIDDYEAEKANKAYTFNDSTSEIYPLVTKDWEPPATRIPEAWGVNSCGPGSEKNHFALHLAGVFKDYGGGLGTVLFNHTEVQGIPFTDLTEPTVAAPKKPIVYWPGDHPYIPMIVVQSADLSDFTGITFWARRSPYSGPGFRPGILERTSADDFNKQLPPKDSDLPRGVSVPADATRASCRSIYTTCGCTNNRQCTPWDPAVDHMPSAAEILASVEPLYPTADAVNTPLKGTYCWDPKLEPNPPWDPTLRCGQTACDFHSDTPIPAMTYNPVNTVQARLWDTPATSNGLPGIDTMTCSTTPYVFKDSTTPSGYFCYRPGIDADPAEKVDRCGDSFIAGTRLTTDWVRYMIPFADLRQGNVDQRSKGIDISMVESLVFAFPGGNLDVWIDEIGFYHKTN